MRTNARLWHGLGRASAWPSAHVGFVRRHKALAILDEVGADKPWDCPKCRDALHPKLPIYTHIGFSSDAKTRCGDYSNNIFERGKYRARLAADDPVFKDLPRKFEIVESHCGQVAYLPPGTRTGRHQGTGQPDERSVFSCQGPLHLWGQFHIEMEGTPDNSRRIMANFLSLARQWGGYNPKGKSIPEPKPP